MKWIALFMVCIFPHLWAAPWDAAVVQDLPKQLAQALAEEVGMRSHRHGVVLQVECKQQDDILHLFLAPRDERDTLFALTVARRPEGVVVKGFCFSHQERQRVEKVVASFINGQTVSWQIEVPTLGFGVIQIRCADLYVEPRHEQGDNLASQLLYGTPVTIVETSQDKKFVRVQGEIDGYMGWLSIDAMATVSPEHWQTWVHMPKIYLQAVCAQLSPGTALGIRADGKLWKFPAQEYVAAPELQFVLPGKSVTPSQIVLTAQRFLPSADLGPNTYLWGGTCVPGLDCSGYVQTVFRLHQMLLPRDADQQYQFGQPVQRGELAPADLVFFGKRKDHPTHVGIYIGDGAYIHCSPKGDYSGVKINRFQGDSEYDKYLQDIYWGAARIIKR